MHYKMYRSLRKKTDSYTHEMKHVFIVNVLLPFLFIWLLALNAALSSAKVFEWKISMVLVRNSYAAAAAVVAIAAGLGL